ncbi:flagellar basal body P-ring formation chaperone FlgA [Pectinatus haikarae]|uniref:Flagella basal body P-ring formation protein FlgA n=1 Tax=Pectinatus haikarae TaxID=349096 RepID=A0ABT9Y5S7_9FIRM|nr:flagellar basal body P-ring formation chaperone FlgA [Pectinatus haikarae]MDQ0203064.1 flagella basal body P-ring formation protein FlgA [Pectinatus haikarae]
MMREKIVIAFAFAIFSFVSSASAAAPVWVTVNSTGVIWGEDILLGSIANIACDDGQRLQDLINMKLGTILQPGGIKNISAYVLKLKIQSSGVDSDNITWSIPDNITVTRMSQTVTSAQIITEAKIKMEQAVRESGEQRGWELEPLNGTSDMVIPPGELQMDAEIPYGIKYAVPTIVYVNFKVKGKDAGKAVCRLQLHIFDNVVVAARAVRANSILTTDDLRLEKKEVSAVNIYYMTDLDKAVGEMPRYPLKPGDVVRENLLASPVLIARGAPVHIIVNHNGLKIQTDGTAMTNGSKDEFIKVKNSITGIVVNGRVVDQNTVEVQMDN